MKFKKIVICISIIALWVACNKEKSYPELKPPPDLTNIGVGQYLPLNFGSKWVYTNYSINKNTKNAIGRTTCRHDSIYNYFYFYDSVTRYTSYGYWYRASEKWFYAGQGQKFLTDLYIDSIQNTLYANDTTSNYRKYIIGGLSTIKTKAGSFNCIKLLGKSKNSETFWEKYYGKGVGLVLSKDYYLNSNRDTIFTEYMELESYKIKK